VGAEELEVIGESVGENLRIRKKSPRNARGFLLRSFAEFALAQIAYTQIPGRRQSGAR
jgi:hypothetical protein